MEPAKGVAVTDPTKAVAAKEPEIVVEHREELAYLLTEAAEIEHGLMCCYLFAAFSLKRDDPGLRPAETAAIERWRRSILDVARDEMVHLALVSNLLTAIGSAPHFARPNFPVSPGYHPAGVVVSLAPFDRATLDHFVYLERPEGVELLDGEGFAPRNYERLQRRGRLMPSAQDYATVGHLYRGIRAGFGSLSRALGESSLLLGDPRQQVGPDVLQLDGLTKVETLADALRAIDTIVLQGEGATERDSERSHYARFLAIRREYEALQSEHPDFHPSRPVAHSPVMRRPPEPGGKVWVSAEPAAALLDLANATYALMLRALAALFGPVAIEPEARAALSDLSVSSMFLLGPLAERLATLPAAADVPGVNAGMTFTVSRSLSVPPDLRALRGLSESARAVSRGIQEHGGSDASLVRGAMSIVALGAALDALAERATTSATPALVATATPATSTPAGGHPPPASPAPDAGSPSAPASPPGAPGVEVARGKSLTILFEAKRCIHSRHCVLDAPGVFLANTPGEWIFPDAATVETLVGVAHDCPSGAIRYQRLDAGPEESAPAVNVARIRENGPLAIRAAMDVAGQGALLRATFCRCGASKNKPFCDGSHVAAGFAATGEPPSGATGALARRDGPLAVTPRKDGPLVVRGNLEVCAGTGRVVARVTQAALCRCGGSANKPFCDGTHAKIGFRADGA